VIRNDYTFLLWDWSLSWNSNLLFNLVCFLSHTVNSYVGVPPIGRGYGVSDKLAEQKFNPGGTIGVSSCLSWYLFLSLLFSGMTGFLFSVLFSGSIY
jgi:hypothetical protein